MKEIVRFQAFDGKVFTDKDECLEHEKFLGADYCKMWDRNGNITDNPENAAFVFINEEKIDNYCGAPTCGGRWFTAICHDGKDCLGIEAEDSGFFYWDEWNGEYYYIETDLVQFILGHAEQFKADGEPKFCEKF